MRAWIGVDPGKKGAIAVLTEDGDATVVDWKSEADMRDAMLSMDANLDVQAVCIERVGAMPGQGVVSMFSFGQNYGFWLGATAILQWPTFTARPQDWQKGLIGKEGAMPVAARLFPQVNLYGPKGGAKDGRADALLIAHYARKQVAA